MIGLGIIAIKREDGMYELHFVSPWELTLALHDCRTSPEKEKEVKERFKNHAKEQNWQPEHVVDKDEMDKIRKAKQCANSKEPDYHVHAADCIMMIED